jgi:hypothetical protein
VSEDRDTSAVPETTKTPLSVDDLKFAIEDARVYQAALTGHIHFAQGKATTLLALYSSVGIAAASGAVAGFTGITPIPVEVALAFTAATVSLLVGCACCFSVLRRQMIAHAGREADLWLWAQEVGQPNVDYQGEPMRDVCIGYLTDLKKRNEVNDGVIRRIDPAMVQAKRWGMLAPFLALAIGGAAVLIKLFF